MKIIEAFEGATTVAPKLTIWWLSVHMLNVIMAVTVLIRQMSLHPIWLLLCCVVIYLAGNGGRAIYTDLMLARGGRQRIASSIRWQFLSFLPLSAFWVNHVWSWYHGV